MRYIKLNSDEFIDFLLSKNVLNLETKYLKNYLFEYKRFTKNKKEISITDVKEIIDSVVLSYDFKNFPKRYSENQITFIYYVLSRKYTNLSYKDIATYFNKKNHSSIGKGLDAFKDRKDLSYYKVFKDIYDVCNFYLMEKRKSL